MIKILVLLIFSTINITSGSLEIVKNDGEFIYYLKDGVTLKFDSTVVTSDEGIYYLSKKHGKLFGHVRLKTPTYMVNSDSLIYYEENNRTVFKLNVSGTDSSALFEAKNLNVVGDTAFAGGGVNIFLLNDSLEFNADSGVYFINKATGKIFKNAEATILRGDTINLLSDSMLFQKDTLIAWHDVQVKSKKFNGTSDYLEFTGQNSDTSRVCLYGNGAFNFHNTKVSGDTILFALVEGQVVGARFSGTPSLETKRKEGTLFVRSLDMKVDVRNDSLVFFMARGKVIGRFEENE